MSNIRRYYEAKNREIEEKLNKRNVDFNQIIKSYEEGMDDNHIMVLYKIEQDELSYILNRYTTRKVINKRKESIKKLEGKNTCNMMGLSKKQQKEEGEVLSIKEALALFEER